VKSVQSTYLDTRSFGMLVLQPFDTHFVNLLANETIDLLEHRFKNGIQINPMLLINNCIARPKALQAYAVTVMVLALIPRFALSGMFAMGKLMY
jgi:hypothetical protein